MGTIFTSLCDFAVSKGVTQREPEFRQQLQLTKERFLALAKGSSNNELILEESHIGVGKQGHANPETSSGGRAKGQRAPKKNQE